MIRSSPHDFLTLWAADILSSHRAECSGSLPPLAQAQAEALASLDQAAKSTVRYGHTRVGAYYHLKRANETLLKGRGFAGLKGQGRAFFWAKSSCPSDPSCLPSATHPRGNRRGADGIERSAALRRAEVPGGLKFWVSVCGGRA